MAGGSLLVHISVPMHEMSVAVEVCRLVEDRLGKAADTLVAVGVTVGDESGIEAATFEFCLAALLAEPPFCGAAPRIICEPGDALHVTYLEVEDRERTND